MAALEDFSKFYFLFATKNDIENNVRAWNNESERYDFYRSHVLNMGNALSVMGLLQQGKRSFPML